MAKRIYNINHNYFDTIDSEHKAYWLGWIYSDGSIHKSTVTIRILKSDIDILKNLLSDLDSNYPIKIIEKSKYNSNWSDLVRLTFTSQQIVSALKKLGCGENKCFNIRLPKLDKKLMKHFVRGYFDGDGHVGYSIDKHNKLRVRWRITSNHKMIKDIHKWLKRTLNINLCITQKKSDNTLTKNIESASFKNIYKICEFIYNQNTVCLFRKYNKYLEIKDNMKNMMVYHADLKEQL